MIEIKQELKDGRWCVSPNLAAVMLPDGCWYEVIDPTLPDGNDAYLSFVQYDDEEVDGVVMVNVDVSDIKAVSYYGIPTAVGALKDKECV